MASLLMSINMIDYSLRCVNKYERDYYGHVKWSLGGDGFGVRKTTQFWTMLAQGQSEKNICIWPL